MACELCEEAGGTPLWRNARMRVVWAPQPDHPAFCRVIVAEHVREMSDLSAGDRAGLMDAVFAVELALIEVLTPDKINLASFGNVVPHLHWHVVPRFRDDPHFPTPVWGVRLRDCVRAPPADFERRMREALQRALPRS